MTPEITVYTPAFIELHRRICSGVAAGAIDPATGTELLQGLDRLGFAYAAHLAGAVDAARQEGDEVAQGLDLLRAKLQREGHVSPSALAESIGKPN